MTVKRPMLWLSTSFVASMYLLAVFGAAVSFTVIFCGLIVLFVQIFRRNNLFSNCIIFLSLVLACTGTYLYGMADDTAVRPFYAFCGEELMITGEIVDEPVKTDRYVRFTMQTVSYSKGREIAGTVTEKISVVSFFDEESDTNFSELNRGDVIMAKCEISLPDSAMNTGGFDYIRYYKAKGIYFQAVAQSDNFFITGHNVHPVSDAIYRFRTKCATLFDTTFPKEEGGVLKAYVMGDKSGILPEISDMFSSSGLSHVLSVSGLHVTVFLASVMAFLKFCPISKRKRLFVCACGVVLFVIFTGASIATLRAGFTCLFANLAQMAFQRSDPLTALSEAAAILCALNPLVIFDASFMLSFSATVGILLLSGSICSRLSFVYSRFATTSRMYKILKTVCDLTAVGLSANIFITPVLIYLFHSFSVMSIVATIVLTPLLSPMLVGGLLFLAVGLISKTAAFALAGFIYMCAKCMIAVSNFFAGFSFSKIDFGTITPFFVLLYVVCMLTLYFAFVKRHRAAYFVSIYSVVFLLLVFCRYTGSVSNVAEVTFINVGQGDCALIKAPGNCDILIDGGEEGNASVGENVIKPYLIQNGVYDIEYAIASHGHEDHVNGLIELLDIMEIKNIVVPNGFGSTEDGGALLQKADEKQVPVTFLEHGEFLKINDEMMLYTILPDEKLLAYTEDENDRSLLLKLVYGDVSFLFAGDISQETENYAAALYPQMLQADVLKVAHHGSKNSSGETFLKSVQPKYAYIPVGENSYEHPGQEVLDRLTANNVIYYRADQQRDVTFYFDQNSIQKVSFDEDILAGGSYALR